MKRALALSLACIVAPVAMAQTPAFTRPYWVDKGVVEAQGRAELQVAPNRARFSAAYVETERTAADASARATERARLAYAAIKAKAGKDARVQTSVSVFPIYDTYKDKDGNVQSYTTPDRISRYSARADVVVTLTDTAKAGVARAAALAAQPESSGQVSFYLERTAEMSREAFAAAAKDAAERAKAAAGAMGATLGPLLVLQEGQGPCLGEWYTPEAGVDDRMYRAEAMASPPPPPPPPSPVAEIMIAGQRVAITEADVERLNLPSDPEPMSIRSGVCAVYAIR
jgi:uncharacterized protein YggE